MGLTTKGSIGARTALTLDDCVSRVQEMRDAAVAINPDVIVLCHGGPIAEPDDAQYVLDRTRGVVGFFGASSMERLPTEIALTENMRRFKGIRAGTPALVPPHTDDESRSIRGVHGQHRGPHAGGHGPGAPGGAAGRRGGPVPGTGRAGHPAPDLADPRTAGQRVPVRGARRDRRARRAQLAAAVALAGHPGPGAGDPSGGGRARGFLTAPHVARSFSSIIEGRREQAATDVFRRPGAVVRNGPAERWEEAVMSGDDEVLARYLGEDEFPVQWESEQEQDLFWVYDDLHCPHPLSPMYFDIGGWWLTCDHMFRRFGTPFAVDWLAKNVNGYLYTAAIPPSRTWPGPATEYGDAVHGARVPRTQVRGPDRRLPRRRPAGLRRALRRLVARPAGPGDAAQLRVPREPASTAPRR